MTNQPNKPVRVLVADDQQLMRDGLASLLSIQEGIDVVGTAANGREAIDQALQLQPDVILMDVRMPVMDGITAAGHLRRQLPEGTVKNHVSNILNCLGLRDRTQAAIYAYEKLSLIFNH